jgi:hypothetical protein
MRTADSIRERGYPQKTFAPSSFPGSEIESPNRRLPGGRKAAIQISLIGSFPEPGFDQQLHDPGTIVGEYWPVNAFLKSPSPDWRENKTGCLFYNRFDRVKPYFQPEIPGSGKSRSGHNLLA